MLSATETRLAAIAAGTVTPLAGLNALNADLTKVVKASAYAVNEKTTIQCVKGDRQISVTRMGADIKCPPGYTKK
jgi:hypothetical protein